MDRVVRMKPDAVGTRYYRGWLRARLGDYDGSDRTDYSRILHDDPNAVDKLCDRSCRYALAGRYQEAEADFDGIARPGGKNPPGPCSAAPTTCTLAGAITTAPIADCDAMIAVDPKIAEAYFYRGLALLSKGEDARAAADFDRALALDQPESLTFQGELRLSYPELRVPDANARGSRRPRSAQGRPRCRRPPARRGRPRSSPNQLARARRRAVSPDDSTRGRCQPADASLAIPEGFGS